MMKLLRRKNRICYYLGIVILVALLGYYYTWQRKVLSNRPILYETRSPWSRTPATASVFQPSTDRLVSSSTNQLDVTTNEIKGTTSIYGRTDENNSSILQMKYINKVIPVLQALIVSIINICHQDIYLAKDLLVASLFLFFVV